MFAHAERQYQSVNIPPSSAGTPSLVSNLRPILSPALARTTSNSRLHSLNFIKRSSSFPVRPRLVASCSITVMTSFRASSSFCNPDWKWWGLPYGERWGESSFSPWLPAGPFRVAKWQGKTLKGGRRLPRKLLTRGVDFGINLAKRSSAKSPSQRDTWCVT